MKPLPQHQKPERTVARAFVIEDEEQMYTLVVGSLRAKGFQVEATTNVRDALAIIEADADFDLAVVDLGLDREGEGFQVISHIDRLAPEYCIRMVHTAYEEEKVRVNSKAWEFILKHDKRAFDVVVQNALDRFQDRQLAPPPKDAAFADRVLERSTHSKIVHQYVLGSFERQKSIYSQQVRALRLIRALVEKGEIKQTTDVAIIGGGAAGATAAVAAAIAGAKVTLFERHPNILALQAPSPRYVHPHIYRWPDPGSENTNADLPFMSWRAGLASTMAQKLQEEFSDWRGRLPQLSFQSLTQISHVEKREHASGFDIHYKDLPLARFSLVIYAQGFGLGVDSYWHGDNLDGPFAPDCHILVIGVGDGGLIDFARAALCSPPSLKCNQEELLTWIARDARCIALAGAMRQRDRDTRFTTDDGDFFPAYDNIPVPADLIHDIQRRARPGTIAYLLHRKPGVFRRDSALINRLIAFLILKSGVGKSPYGEVPKGPLAAHPPGPKSLFNYTSGGKPVSLLVNRVVDRRGDDLHPPERDLLVWPFEAWKPLQVICTNDREEPVYLESDTLHFWNHAVRARS